MIPTIGEDETGHQNADLADGESDNLPEVALPDKFPIDDVPLVQGSVISAYGFDQTGQAAFSLILRPSTATGVQEAVDLLTAKGFTVTAAMNAGGASTRTLSSPKWDVLVSWTDVDGETTFSYTVAAASK